MERAKRLELLREFLHSFLEEGTYNSLATPGAQGGAHAEKPSEIDPQLEAWLFEVAEIIGEWPTIKPSQRMALVFIDRFRTHL